MSFVPAAASPCHLRLWARRLKFTAITICCFLASFTFTWSGLSLAVALYFLSSVGVTVGLHRLLTHRSFKTSRAMECFWGLCGTLSGQGGVIGWVATHRLHHGHTEGHRDPHTPHDGFWWSQMGWVLHSCPTFDDPAVQRRYAPDLMRLRFFRFLDRFDVPIVIAWLGLLYLAGEIYDGVGLSWLIWGGCICIGASFHMTGLVNSAAHRWGYRSFPTADDSRNVWWLSLLTHGEGWHNNHHASPRSARHGEHWLEFDFGFAVIRMLRLFHLAWDVRTPRRRRAPSERNSIDVRPAQEIPTESVVRC